SRPTSGSKLPPQRLLGLLPELPAGKALARTSQAPPPVHGLWHAFRARGQYLHDDRVHSLHAVMRLPDYRGPGAWPHLRPLPRLHGGARRQRRGVVPTLAPPGAGVVGVVPLEDGDVG